MKTMFFTIKRQIKSNLTLTNGYDNSDIDIKKYIDNVLWYKRHMKNIGVERIREQNRYSYKEFRDWYYTNFESTDIDRKHERYYPIGLKAQVSTDLQIAMQKTIEARRNGKSAKVQFQKYDKYKESFTVQNMHCDSERQAYLSIIDNNSILFKANKYIHFLIYLDENLGKMYNNRIVLDKKEQYSFGTTNVKQVTFTREFGKYYIALVIEVNWSPRKSLSEKNVKVVVIDTGIHNPIMLFNGEKSESIRLSEKEIRKILYYNKRIDRLNSILSMKLKKNNYIKSKSYYRLLTKIRKSYRNRTNIVENWQKQTSSRLAKIYDVIIIDEFKTPRNTKSKYNAAMNTSNRLHAMSLFFKRLSSACSHYGSYYTSTTIYNIKNTTNMCPKCGCIRGRKLKLHQRTFSCPTCGYSNDRDVVGAINCYSAFESVLNSRTFTYSCGTAAFL